ncbi:gamma carbonic anhydrase family protein, partial [Morganella morganii]
MVNKLRPYLTLTPSVGKNVMIDDSSVIIGDVRLA